MGLMAMAWHGMSCHVHAICALSAPHCFGVVTAPGWCHGVVGHCAMPWWCLVCGREPLQPWPGLAWHVMTCHAPCRHDPDLLFLCLQGGAPELWVIMACHGGAVGVISCPDVAVGCACVCPSAFRVPMCPPHSVRELFNSLWVPAVVVVVVCFVLF